MNWLAREMASAKAEIERWPSGLRQSFNALLKENGMPDMPAPPCLDLYTLERCAEVARLEAERLTNLAAEGKRLKQPDLARRVAMAADTARSIDAAISALAKENET